ncbi:MAG: hypothetical protein IT317_03970 [Anaerolineales bacterium]|nr:hypothetical protein [Anaerolineales bacterium]
MSFSPRWKTAFLCLAAILIGLAAGPQLNRLIVAPPGAAQAAAAPSVALAPGSTEAVFTCTPSYIGVFSTRVHVLCTAPAETTIYYFAAPTSDSKNANRVLSVMLTAKALGKNLQIYYDSGGNGSAYGCQANDCRPINAIEVKP